MTEDIDAYINMDDVLGNFKHTIYATIINGSASTTILVDSIEYTHTGERVIVELKGYIPNHADKTIPALAFANEKHPRVTIKKDESTRGGNVIMED